MGYLGGGVQMSESEEFNHFWSWTQKPPLCRSHHSLVWPCWLSSKSWISWKLFPLTSVRSGAWAGSDLIYWSLNWLISPCSRPHLKGELRCLLLQLEMMGTGKHSTALKCQQKGFWDWGQHPLQISFRSVSAWGETFEQASACEGK